jgi:diguanylate cyclase (GGDEF)-like protein/PAS domain S-box-containing protein
MISRVARIATVSFVGLLAAMIYLSAAGISGQRSTTAVASVASRQQELVERYVQEVLLRDAGEPANPDATIKVLVSTNRSLLDGGVVPVFNGSSAKPLTIPAVTDPAARADLQAEIVMVARLERQGRALVAARTPSQNLAALSALRSTRADLATTTRDVASAVLRVEDKKVKRLVGTEIGFGIVGIIAALVLSLIFRRSGRLSETARFEALVKHATDLLLTTNDKGVVTFASPSSAELLGVTHRELFGTRSADLIHPDDRAHVAAKVFSIQGLPNRTVTTTCRFRRADGRWLTFETSYTNLLKDPAVRGIVLNAHDITAQGELTRELADQAFHDSLTGLANRVLLRDRLEHALAQARRSGDVVSVLFCDLDNFKIINDTLGHDAGDVILTQVAERLRANVRDGDTVARLGGDEFAIICENATRNDSEETAKRVLDALRQPFAIGKRDTFVSVSIGSADNRFDALDADELLRRADIAMYVAKGQGRDRYEVFRPQMQTELVKRHELHGDLREALEHDQLFVGYQPLVDLATGQIRSFEALLRWRHPERGPIEPAEFIPVAEETGLIMPIGRFVLGEACEQAARWHAAGSPGISIGVNVAAQQIIDPEFTSDVRDALRRAGLEPQYLTVELTETTLLANTELVTERLYELKQLGVRIAIDDFGTGYSSLAYLRDFPVDYLKIDRSFVAELSGERAQQGRTMIDTIIALSHNLNLSVVAEGIEEDSQRDHLRASGCNTGQGFLYAQALTSEEATAFLAERQASPTALLQ